MDIFRRTRGLCLLLLFSIWGQAISTTDVPLPDPTTATPPTTIAATTSTPTTTTTTPATTQVITTTPTTITITPRTVVTSTEYQTTDSSSDPSGSMTTGAMVGIVIGVIVGSLVIAAVIFFLIRRRQQKTGKWYHVFTNLFTKNKPIAGSDDPEVTESLDTQPTDPNSKYEPLKRGPSQEEPTHTYEDTAVPTDSELERQTSTGSGPLYEIVSPDATRPSRIHTGGAEYVNASSIAVKPKTAAPPNSTHTPSHQYANARKKKPKKQKSSNKTSQKDKGHDDRSAGLDKTVPLPSEVHTHDAGFYENVDSGTSSKSHMPMDGAEPSDEQGRKDAEGPELPNKLRHHVPAAYEEYELNSGGPDGPLYVNEDDLKKENHGPGATS